MLGFISNHVSEEAAGNYCLSKFTTPSKYTAKLFDDDEASSVRE